MVIEYKIKFQGDTVTVTQSVEPAGAKANDSGGDFTENPDDKGGDFTENPDDSGGDFTEPPDDGGGSGRGRGRVIAVVLGPLVLGEGGPGPVNGANSKSKTKKPATKADIKKLLAAGPAAKAALKSPKKK